MMNRSVALLLVLAPIGVAGCAPAPARDVPLVLRGMTFLRPDAPETPNPVITLRAGEVVRLVLSNESKGMLHDVVITAWNVKTEQIRTGETAEVVFRVPDTTGRTEYRCTLHAELMRGIVEVVP